MTTNLNLICNKCKHRRSFGCAAFPDGIAEEILIENSHSKPHPDQANELVFTEGEPTEEEYFGVGDE